MSNVEEIISEEITEPCANCDHDGSKHNKETNVCSGKIIASMDGSVLVDCTCKGFELDEDYGDWEDGDWED